MRVLISLCVGLVLSAAVPPARTELSDQEIIEFTHLNRQMTDLQKKLNEAQEAVNGYGKFLQMHYDELRKSHGADGCSLDIGMRWANCPSIMNKAKGK